MKFSVPQNALIVIADGKQATFYKNAASSGVKIEKTGELNAGINDGRGPAPLPPETTKHEIEEANFAKHIANDLYKRVHKGEFDSLVLIADPQTLGQIRPSLHQEVTDRITGELAKTLTNSTIADIEDILMKAAA